MLISFHKIPFIAIENIFVILIICVKRQHVEPKDREYFLIIVYFGLLPSTTQESTNVITTGILFSFHWIIWKDIEKCWKIAHPLIYLLLLYPATRTNFPSLPTVKTHREKLKFYYLFTPNFFAIFQVLQCYKAVRLWEQTKVETFTSYVFHFIPTPHINQLGARGPAI